MERNKEKLILKIFRIAFLILFLIIVINAIFFNKTIQINYIVPVMLIGTILVYMMIYLFYYISKKYFKIMEIKNDYKIILAIIIFLIQIIIAGLVYAHCGWDCGGVIDNAFCMYKGEQPDINYFSMYPNNIAILMIFKYLYVLVGYFNVIELQNIYWIAVIFNIIMIDLAVVFTILTSKKIFGNKITYLVFLFIIPLILFSPHIIVPYTDTISLWIPIAIYYFYLKSKENKKIKFLYLFIEAVLIVVGYFIKPTCIIMAIAIILVELINISIKSLKNKKNLKNAIIIMLIFALGYGITMETYQYFRYKNFGKYVSEEQFEKNVIPVTHFLMMGMQEAEIEEMNNKGKNNIMYGAYNGEDVANTKKIEGKKEKQNYNIEIIKQRLQKFGILGYLNFIYNKMNWILSDGTFYYGAEGTFFVTDPYNKSAIGKALQGFFNLNSNKYQYITANIMQIAWIALLVGIIATYKDTKKEIYVLKFSIIGIILFIVLFEGRSRYLYNYIPMFILVGTYGVANIIKNIENQIKKVKRR